MPYNKRKQKCKQADGTPGSYVLSYTDKKGKKRRACHTSKKKMQGQIAAIEAESKVMKITHEDLRQIIREELKIINEITPEIIDTPAGGGDVMAATRQSDYHAKSKILPDISITPEDVVALIDRLAKTDKTVKRVLSSSDEEIVEYLFDNLPTPTRRRKIALYNKGNIDTDFLYTQDEELFLEIHIDGPAWHNLFKEFDIKELLFESLTESGIEAWAINLHGDLFAQIKTSAIKAVGQEEFKKYKNQAREAIQKDIVDNKAKILEVKAQAFQEIASIFRKNPSLLLVVQGLDTLTSIDIPGDFQKPVEEMLVTEIQIGVTKAMKNSGLGRQIVEALDTLNDMVEEMHEKKRAMYREEGGLIGKALSIATEGKNMKITHKHLRQIVQEELAKLPPYKNYAYGVDQISSLSPGQEDIIGHT
mgnify:CR=1 FL=1